MASVKELREELGTVEGQKAIAAHDAVEDSGNRTVTVRTQLYEDFKRYAKKILLVVGIVLALVFLYLLFDFWVFPGLVIGGFLGLVAAKWYARKFMSYANLVRIELGDDERPDAVHLTQVPFHRFASCRIIDDTGKKSALAAPFLTLMGPAYVVDRFVPREEQAEKIKEQGLPVGDPDKIPDVVVLNPIHKNVHFINRYLPEFLQTRKELLTSIRENWALKDLSVIKIWRESVSRSSVLTEYLDKLLFELKSLEEPKDVEIEKLKEALGVGQFRDPTLQVSQQNIPVKKLKVEVPEKVAAAGGGGA